MSLDELNRQAFREEAAELLAELEQALLHLESSPDDADLVARVFRAMHTIKGSGAMFGFDDIAEFTHDVETTFDHVRSGRLPVDRRLLDLTLAARDRIQLMLDSSAEGSDPDPAASREILAGFAAVLEQAGMGPAGTAGGNSVDKAASDNVCASPEACSNRLYRVRFKPQPGMFLSGLDPLSLVQELRELGAASTTTHMELPPLDELAPELCYCSFDVLLCTAADPQAISDVFIFVEDDAEVSVQFIASHDELEDDAETRRLGEILLQRGDIAVQDLDHALSSQKRLGEILVDSGLVTVSKVNAALAEQQAVRDMRAGSGPGSGPGSGGSRQESQASLRVATGKLDNLVNLVGELVIVQDRIRQLADQRRDPALNTLSEELERLSDELRESTLSIRMLPIGTTFSRFQRLVRDLSRDLGKEIRLETVGGDTELDKTVIDQLGDPLVHLLRNAMDHGIGTPAERETAGKPAQGRIVLSAEHSGGEVLIRITDDGKGLDAERIRARGVERGLIAPEAELSEADIFRLILEPGFSTAQQVTAVSGRGVGMDVVKRNIEELRGSLSIASRKGQGSTFTIKLPLTLAIIEGLQVRVAGEFFVLPLAVVEECIERELDQDEERRGRRFVSRRGELVPYIRLREWFRVPGLGTQREQIVIAQANGSRLGIAVDEVIGEHQTVIKSLGPVYRNIPGISGATVKGDGSMALILDVPCLYRTVLDSARHAH